MSYITRARHIGYDGSLTPIVREMRSITCLAQIPEFVGARHIDWGHTTGLPLAAVAWYCCGTYFCTDAEILAGDCYKLPVCWPLGAGPGITKRLNLYVTDNSNCWSARAARGKRTVLNFDGVDSWTGSVTLRGGALDLVFKCNAGATGSATKFTLSWTGCDSGSVTTGNYCVEPLLVQFPAVGISFGHCCDCHTSAMAPPTTDVDVQVDFFVAGNCHHTIWARHVGYEDDLTPRVAIDLPCPEWDLNDCYHCINMRCPLVATITGCAAWNGTYDANYGSDKWIMAGTPFLNNITCTNLAGGVCGSETDPNYVRLTVFIICGFGGGSASVDIPAHDLEDLDVTIPVVVTNPDGNPTCCSGTVNIHLIRA